MRSKKQKIVVATAIKLKRSQIIEIEKDLARVMGSDAFFLEVVEEPHLLGGIIIRLNSLMIDFSLAGRLEQVNNRLIHV